MFLIKIINNKILKIKYKGYFYPGCFHLSNKIKQIDIEKRNNIESIKYKNISHHHIFCIVKWFKNVKNTYGFIKSSGIGLGVVVRDKQGYIQKFNIRVEYKIYEFNFQIPNIIGSNYNVYKFYEKIIENDFVKIIINKKYKIIDEKLLMNKFIQYFDIGNAIDFAYLNKKIEDMNKHRRELNILFLLF